MKRTTIALIAFILIVSGSAAVTGYNGSEDRPHIMGSGSSASASRAVSPNGTRWQAEVSMVSRSSALTNSSATDANFSGSTVSFSGTLQAPTPCHVIDHEVEPVESEDNSFTINIRAVEPETGNETMCAEVLNMVRYEASFTKEEPYRLEIQHNGRKVRAVEHPGYGKESTGSQEGVLASFFSWLGSLF
ncbi:MAG: hypothetical protein ABEI58_03460 [Candidatus Nanohaloarchaea archaeon]